MKSKITGFSLLALLCLLVSASASADVLYSNGPVNGTINGWIINFGAQVADSFTLSSNSTLTGVDNVGLLVVSGHTPSTVDWSIWNGGGPGGGGTDLDGPTTASLTNTFDFSGTGLLFGDEIYTSSFSLPSIVLGPGTYWLELDNATQVGPTPPDTVMGWDQNDGPLGNGTGSEAWQSVTGFLTAASSCGGISTPPPTGYCSESFEIVGTQMQTQTPTVPEPGSMAQFGTGLLLMTGLLRRKLCR